MTKTIGIIGLGSIGARHAKNLMELGCNVMAYDPKTAVLPGFDEVIDQSDAIIIASPTECHIPHLIAAQEKPTFVEKPIGDCNPTEWKKHVHNVKMVGYMCRFHDQVKLSKKMIDEGKIGQPRWARFTVAQRSVKYDELILNWLSHELDLACYLLGPASVMAAVQYHNIVDIVIRHFNGCQTTVHADYETDPEIRSFSVSGTKDTIHIDLCRADWNEIYAEEIRAFLSCLDGEKTLGCTAREALHVLDLCLEAKKIAGVE